MHMMIVYLFLCSSRIYYTVIEQLCDTFHGSQRANVCEHTHTLVITVIDVISQMTSTNKHNSSNSKLTTLQAMDCDIVRF